MKLLLDTHIFLWSLLDPSKLVDHVAEALENPENELWLSPISTWETFILVEKGRVSLKVEPVDWLHSVFQKIPFHEAPLNHMVAIQSRVVTLSHQDPADRFLAATAKVYDLVLVTGDERLLHSTDYEIMANR